jgi:hypothetical protein
VECFREHPQSFWERNRTPATQWDEETFLRAIDDNQLVPQADPNTSSHSQRVMKIMALKQLQSANPGMYDEVAIDKAALRAIGWSNPEQFLKPEAQRNQPTPELIKGMEDLKIAHQKADADTMRAQAAMAKAQQPAPAPGVAPGPDPIKLMSEQNKARQMELSAHRDAMNDQNRDLDRAADLRLEQMRLDRDDMNDEVRMQHERDMQQQQHIHDAMKLAMQIKGQRKQ